MLYIKMEYKALQKNIDLLVLHIPKIMESIVTDAIVTQMMKHNILSGHQHELVPGIDCITQLLLYMEDWTSMIEKGKHLI